MSATTPPAYAATTSAADEALASRAKRLVAAIVDGLVLWVPVYVLGNALDDADWVVGLLYVAASIFYAPLLLARGGDHNGQTLGKQLLGVRVVPKDGGTVSLGRAMKREFLGRTVLSAITLGIYSLIDSLWCLWDGRRQTLHDKIGGTYVFKADAHASQASSLS
jgi:uncharacterized RDD family membrane protein YckC